MLYGSLSRFLWTDQNGVTHDIVQGEGGERGCPLMPALFALAIHNSLVAADMQLAGSELILFFFWMIFI